MKNDKSKTVSGTEETRARKEAMNMVDEYIHDIDFPCNKDDLFDFASDNGAPDEVLDVINQLPDKQFASTADLARGMAAAR